MTKTIITLTVASMFVAGSVFTSCKSPAQKEETAQTEVQDAQKNLDEAKTDANAESQKVASTEEWLLFKSDADAKIKSNEDRIAVLTAKMNKPGVILDPLYKKRIQTLEQQNKDLKNRLIAYENDQTDWSKFKREFNHDMDELGSAFKDLTVDNTK